MDVDTLKNLNENRSGVPYEEYLPHLNQALRDAGCTTVLRVAHFMGQILHESGGLVYLREIHDGSNYEGRVDLGNTQPGDGKMFRGRGVIQLTGRHWATEFSKWAYEKGMVNSPTYFVDYPEKMEEPEWAFRTASFYWTVARPGLNGLCDRDDLVAVTKAVNGGTRGLDDRRMYYQRAKGFGERILPTSEGGSKLAVFDVDMSDQFGFGSYRSTSGIQRVVIHTTENPVGTPAENVARYQINSQSGSYHYLVDTTGKRIRCNTDDWVTWSTGNNAGNVQGLNLSFVVYSASTRAQWLAQEKMLRAGALVVADWCSKYEIPVTKVTTGRGICGHGDLRAFGGTDHTDPGANFPWDVFVKYVNEAMSGGSSSSEGEKLSSSVEKQISEIHFQLLNKWPQLGGLTLVDAVSRLCDQVFGPEKAKDGSWKYNGWAGVPGNGGNTLVEAVAEIQKAVASEKGVE